VLLGEDFPFEDLLGEFFGSHSLSEAKRHDRESQERPVYVLVGIRPYVLSSFTYTIYKINPV
jgi:hypothetical protein